MSADLSPSRHDDVVRTQALELLAQGYDVRARIEGWFELPDFIGGYRPDIVARKDDRFVIVEVEKGETDWPKISAFELYVSGRPNFELRTIAPWKELERKTGT